MIAAFELGFVELTKLYSRDIALSYLDPNRKGVKGKPTMFNVSERHVRRVETIRAKRPLDAARLESIAMSGGCRLSVSSTRSIIHRPLMRSKPYG